MALPSIHLCQFNFSDQDIRVTGTELDGGTSLSGISETIATDGGGKWQASFSGADFGGIDDSDRSATLAWRAINAGLSGGARAVVEFCDRHHQPVFGTERVPHDDSTPLDDGSEYTSSGANARVLVVVNGQAGGLNCTVLQLALVSERPLLGGERFTHVHATWLDRAYEIITVVPVSGGYQIAIQPPIRGGIAVGDPLDFDDVRCVMRRSSAPTNALSIGLYSSAAIEFVEDMREPSA